MGIKYQIDIPLDHNERINAHKSIIKSNPFLKRLYTEWYEVFLQESSSLPDGKLVEIGSGGGFLKEIIPSLIASDILPAPDNDLTFSALNMPFENCSVSGLFMLNVFHHLPDAAKFLNEANRVLMGNGEIIMIEPANSKWGRLIFSKFHHEPFVPEDGWTIGESGPMTGANGALPWIVFIRDRDIFKERFPELVIEEIIYHTPIRYILSGGVSFKQIVPDFSFRFFSNVDKLLVSLSKQLSMFMTIKVRKIK